MEARGNGTSSPLNDIFRQFHSRHLDAQGEKLRYTAVFNRFLEAIIDDPGWDLPVRGLAWMARQCWGNDSDYPVEKINGEELGQKDFAERVGIAKQRASEVFQVLYEQGYLTRAGHRVYLSDNPAETAKSNNSGKKSVEARTFYNWFHEVWKVRSPTDYLAFKSVEDRYFELKKVLLHQYRAEKVGRTNGGATSFNSVIEEKSSSSAVEVIAVPPAPLQKAEEEDFSFEKLKENFPKHRMDEAKALKAFYCLKIPERRAAVRALSRFTESARWHDKEGQFIPFASKWLLERQWEAEPPPAFKPATRANSVNGKSFEESREMIRQALEQERAAKRAERGK